MTTDKKYFIPNSIEQAFDIAKSNLGSFKYLAGGTDLLVNKFQGTEIIHSLIDLTHIKELKGVSVNKDYLRIGSLEVLEDLKKSKLIAEEFPMLIQAALSVGSPLIRKTATIGGNLLCENRCLFFNQSEWWRESVGFCLKCEGDICVATKGKKVCYSEFVSDTAPALIAMDAFLEIADITETKKVPIEQIYTGDGVQPRNLTETAIVTAILLPRNRSFKTDYQKLRERESLEFTSLTSAVASDINGKLKIVLSGVDPKPVVVVGSVKDSKNDLIRKAIRQSRAIDNDMYSRNYRREMIEVYLKRSFSAIEISSVSSKA